MKSAFVLIALYVKWVPSALRSIIAVIRFILLRQNNPRKKASLVTQLTHKLVLFSSFVTRITIAIIHFGGHR